MSCGIFVMPILSIHSHVSTFLIFYITFLPTALRLRLIPTDLNKQTFCTLFFCRLDRLVFAIYLTATQQPSSQSYQNDGCRNKPSTLSTRIRKIYYPLSNLSLLPIAVVDCQSQFGLRYTLIGNNKIVGKTDQVNSEQTLPLYTQHLLALFICSVHRIILVICIFWCLANIIHLPIQIKFIPAKPVKSSSTWFLNI